MTKQKRIITRLLVVLAALTLISCCFLGSTFARYTSGKNGSASVEVAKWAVTMEGTKEDKSIEVTFGKLSPSIADFSASTNRENKTEQVLVATINNNSDVAAKITASASEFTVWNGTTEITTGNVYTNAKKVLKINWFYTTTESSGTESGKNNLTSETAIIIAGKEGTAPENSIAQTTTVKIYAEAVWTSQDSGSDEATSDAIDTSVGEGVTAIKTTITCTATQATQIPAPAGS